MILYNDSDRKVCAWITEIIRAGHLPEGLVDERPIEELSPDDCEGTSHFFCGVGGWPLALALAGWPDSIPVWTGSCPCQPFSVAGKRKGTKDVRHVWPIWRELIEHCTPPIIFGEQVASKDGRAWLCGVRDDLEALGYAVGAADLCAAGAGEEAEGRIVRGNQITYERIICGAPHIRQRLYWMAYAGCECDERRRDADKLAGSGQATEEEARQRQRRRDANCDSCAVGGMAYDEREGRRLEPQRKQEEHERPHAGCCSMLGGVGDVLGEGPQRQRWNGDRSDQPRRQPSQAHRPATSPSALGQWSDFDIIPCRDDKARRVESGTFPLAHGVPARVVRLRGYGNAIVPPLAVEFIKASLEALREAGG
jgi:DNA (cytosine-5)-methyltransferase 1